MTLDSYDLGILELLRDAYTAPFLEMKNILLYDYLSYRAIFSVDGLEREALDFSLYPLDDRRNIFK